MSEFKKLSEKINEAQRFSEEERRKEEERVKKERERKEEEERRKAQAEKYKKEEEERMRKKEEREEEEKKKREFQRKEAADARFAKRAAFVFFGFVGLAIIVGSCSAILRAMGSDPSIGGTIIGIIIVVTFLLGAR